MASRYAVSASEPNQANLVLGEGALARGAAAHHAGAPVRVCGGFVWVGGRFSGDRASWGLLGGFLGWFCVMA